MINKQKQQGAVLLMAMIFLIVITIIGVNAVNSSNMKTQTVGNNIASKMVYTGAETALAMTASNTNMFNVSKSLSTGSTQSPTLANVGGLTLNSRTNFIAFKQKCPVGKAISSIMTCKVWTINATANLAATAARDEHMLGVAVVE